MKSKTNTLAQQIRYQKWIKEVQDCHNRPSDMSVEEWCEANGLKYSTYYRHHLMVKEMCLEHMETQLPAVSQTNGVVSYDKPANTFVELKAPVVPASSDSISISCGKAKIELSENVSEAFLIKLFGALGHVE